MSKLTNKIAVITGGNNCIGYATTKEFISHGAVARLEKGKNK